CVNERILNTLADRLLPTEVYAEAYRVLISSEKQLNKILFRQACVDHIVEKLFSISAQDEYKVLWNAIFHQWVENVVVDWLRSSDAVYNHCNMLCSFNASDKYAWLMYSVRGLVIEIMNMQPTPWQTATVTDVEEMRMALILTRIVEADAVYANHRGKYAGMSLYDINRLVTINSQRINESKIRLNASCRVLGWVQWTKTIYTHRVRKEVEDELKYAPFFDMIGCMRVHTINAESVANGKQVTAMVILKMLSVDEWKWDFPQNVLHDVLERYYMTGCPIFLKRYLPFPQRGMKQLKWNRRKWLLLAWRAKPSATPSFHQIRLLPTDLIRKLILYL
ncbi:MAG: hypothetical protein Harvfovirus29_1, partial [Harvfovirus sp.]